MIYVSPAEPASVQHALTNAFYTATNLVDVSTSSLPERYGADFLWRGNGHWWGVQRKTIADFLASCDDGRLTREVAQMSDMVTMPMLAIEGRDIPVQYAGRVDRGNLERRLLTIQSRGVGVREFRDTTELVAWIVEFWRWAQAEHHETAQSLPKPAGDWGKPTNAQFQALILQSLPGVGSKVARKVVEALGCPMRIDATREDLMSVPGVGPRMADKILGVFGETVAQ